MPAPETCSVDQLLRLIGTPRATLVLDVCGADTACPGLAPQAAGLRAVSPGLSRYISRSDAAMGARVARCRRARVAQDETATGPRRGTRA